MDGKFRLAFAETGNTPSGADYLAQDAQSFDRLRDALVAAQQRTSEWALPYIAYKFVVFAPSTIAVLHQQFIAST